jgi:hypothetical protein
MKHTFGLVVGALTALGIALASPAGATQLIKLDSGAGTSFTLEFTNALNALDAYDITGVAAGGKYGTIAVTGLLANPTQPFSNAFHGVFYNNDFFTLGPDHVSHFSDGIILTLANGQWAHIFGSATGETKTQSILTLPTGGFVATPAQTFAFTFTPIRADVPEPASWALMILGFGAIGSRLRRRHTAYAA